MGKSYTTFQKGIAFDTYYMMGAMRDLSRLTQYLDDTEFPYGKPSHPTLKRWSSEENWQAQIKQRDIENSQNIQKQTDREVVRTKAQYRTYIAEQLKKTGTIEQRFSKLISDTTKKIKTGELKVESIKELNDLGRTHARLKALELQMIKTDLVMIGEADSRQDHTVTFLDALKERRRQRDNDDKA